jgi:hypothetical protein
VDDNLSILLIVALAIIAAVTLNIATTWIRARQKHAALALRAEEDAGMVVQLSRENEALHGQVERLGQRLQVLERIATDPGTRAAAEIEALR